ncbi:MAG: hypothetical protein US42_C0001G0045 [Candidatus Magasanikbacteria bacterium GW2011_GWC2_37_14]|uniref:Uncharacterized protein n=1 Tax=Candidatus Magasanikbacteria bacterium GW2011_GWC2_37_14 TaxID=1619046 RepID=A0A0G0IVN1_9BACT|nr:MAG: hypothetical protein US42_C0001G0045 [Candidatus Magasanikbacteria bacterium GW2011_GWC2_37_14]
MTDSILRHLIASAATLVTFLAYISGYFSGKVGWWWTALGLIIIYVAMFKFVDAGGHH